MSIQRAFDCVHYLLLSSQYNSHELMATMKECQILIALHDYAHHLVCY